MIDRGDPVGWALRAPGSKGCKVYAVLVWDRWTACAWGSESGGPPGLRFLRRSLAVPESAHRFAVAKTGEKESRGYLLWRPPVRIDAGAVLLEKDRERAQRTVYEALRYGSTNGPNGDLRRLMAAVLSGEGTPI